MNSWKRGFSITRSSFKFGKERPGFASKHLKRSLTNNILPTNLPPRILKPFDYIKQKFRNILEFYEEFSGIKDITLSQEKVEEVGDKLMAIQSERRKAFAHLLEIQNNLKAISAQLENTRRGDNRYINLITEEYKLIKQEEMQQEKFKDIDKAERDLFTLFSHSVKTTHEKEKAQAQRTKYWSIIGSILGTLIGMCGSSINSHKKQSELKKLISETSNAKLESELNKFLEDYTKVSRTKYYEEMKNMSKNVVDDMVKNTIVKNDSKMHVYLNEILLKTNGILLNMEETLKIMENIRQFELYQVKSDNGSDVLFLNLQSLKDTLHYENERLITYFWRGFMILGGLVLIRSLC